MTCHALGIAKDPEPVGTFRNGIPPNYRKAPRALNVNGTSEKAVVKLRARASTGQNYACHYGTWVGHSGPKGGPSVGSQKQPTKI